VSVIFDRLWYNAPVPVPFIIALVLGLRHALDPDHLAAVSTLLLDRREGRVREAAVLGLAWGMGHATTLALFGLPVVLFSRSLPEPVRRGAEVMIGGVIGLLALRLLYRWRRGQFHVHPHDHGSIRHVHGHVHGVAHRTGESPEHRHEHAERLGRTPAASFGIGLMHGIAGSAAAGVLLMGTVSGRGEGVVALLIFAAGTALSMSLLSVAVAHTIARGVVRRRLPRLIPLLGAAGLAFGVWYSLGALQVL
jgi:ABC-type nickel/cobalt efflux system permease component RcnA